ncbi:uncharacterized protein [Ptychodera flava]|uniref:uncharacterized protein n=1 Tax=Ptychodera flava TaxID=63121 RepID=UPI003969C635
MAEHQWWMIVAIVLTTLAFATTIAFNALGAINPGVIFLNSTGDLADKYYFILNPAGWTFSIWSVIYIWLILAILYTWTTLCRKNKSDYVYVRPKVLSFPFYICLSINFGLNVAWLLLWDRQYVPASTLALCLICFTLYICIGASHANLYQYLPRMMSSQKLDVWCIRILIHNGLAIYATWCTIAALLNIGSTLVYWVGLSQETAGIICLSVLAFEVVLWAMLEVLVLDRWFRFTLTIWPVVIWALAGSLYENWDLTASTCIYSFVLIVIAGCIFIFRIGVFLWRVCSVPLVKKHSRLLEHEMTEIGHN